MPATRTADLATTHTRQGTGWWSGFANLFRKEWAAWTRTRSRWVQPLIWSVVLVGPMTLPLYLMRDLFASETTGVFETAREMFFSFGPLATSIGAVLIMQGSVITERQSGTASWVLSKPVARSAMLAAKLVANALALLAAAFGVPAVMAYALLSLERGAALPLPPFVAALGLSALNLLFYLVLTLALGAIVRARGVVLGVPLALMLAGDLMVSLLGRASEFSPLLLPRFVPFVAAGGALPTVLPAVATVAFCVVLMIAALIVFGREDL